MGVLLVDAYYNLFSYCFLCHLYETFFADFNHYPDLCLCKNKNKKCHINSNPSFECYVTPKMGPPKMTSRNLAQMIKCEYSIIWED